MFVKTAPDSVDVDRLRSSINDLDREAMQSRRRTVTAGVTEDDKAACLQQLREVELRRAKLIEAQSLGVTTNMRHSMLHRAIAEFQQKRGQ